MPQITIRGIAPEIEQKIRRIARDKNTSINQVIKEIIHKELDDQRQKPRAASLKKLAGGWSLKEASDFEHAIRFCEQIDGEMWL